MKDFNEISLDFNDLDKDILEGCEGLFDIMDFQKEFKIKNGVVGNANMRTWIENNTINGIYIYNGCAYSDTAWDSDLVDLEECDTVYEINGTFVYDDNDDNRYIYYYNENILYSDFDTNKINDIINDSIEGAGLDVIKSRSTKATSGDLAFVSTYLVNDDKGFSLRIGDHNNVSNKVVHDDVFCDNVSNYSVPTYTINLKEFISGGCFDYKEFESILKQKIDLIK